MLDIQVDTARNAILVRPDGPVTFNGTGSWEITTGNENFIDLLHPGAEHTPLHLEVLGELGPQVDHLGSGDTVPPHEVGREGPEAPCFHRRFRLADRRGDRRANEVVEAGGPARVPFGRWPRWG